MNVNREEYIKRALNAVSIKIGSAIESNYDSIWSLSCIIDDYIKAVIEESYDKGHNDGYSEGYENGYNNGYNDGADDQYND
jgi:hypothetical protein